MARVPRSQSRKVGWVQGGGSKVRYFVRFLSLGAMDGIFHL